MTHADAIGAQAIDRDNALRAARLLVGPDGDADALVAETRDQLTRWFAQPQNASQLERLATALVRHRRLDRDEIRRLTRTERT